MLTSFTGPLPAHLRRCVVVASLLFGLLTLHVLADHQSDSSAHAIITAQQSSSAAVPPPEQPIDEQHVAGDCILFLAAVGTTSAVLVTAAGRDAPRSTLRPVRGWTPNAQSRLPRLLLCVQRT